MKMLSIKRPTTPKRGSLWRNRKTGNLYQVLSLATFEEDLDFLVLYMSVDQNTGEELMQWARRRTVFLEKFDAVK